MDFKSFFEEFWQTLSDHRHRRRSTSRKRRSSYEYPSSPESDHTYARPSASETPRKLIRVKQSFEDPPPTFLSICRFLITLEEHISKYSQDINRLFTSSLSLERDKPGSSNELLTTDNLKLLEQLKHHLKDQIVEGFLPLRMLSIARSFVNDFDRLVKENVPEVKEEVVEKKPEMLIDIEML